jgi:hypothetical protein
VLTKLAERKVLQRAAVIAAKQTRGQATEQAVHAAAAVARQEITRELRRAARQISNAAEDEMVHHIHTLVGHPPYVGRGNGLSAFPTIGVEWIANNRWNLVKLSKDESGRKRHVWLHERAFVAERLVVTFSGPPLTATRVLVDVTRNDSLDVTVNVTNCRR